MLELVVVFFSRGDIFGALVDGRGFLIVVADEPCEDSVGDASVGSRGIGEVEQERVFVRGFFGTSRAACEVRASDSG